MDWTRARIILIVAFTTVNVVLAVMLWSPGVSPDKAMAQLAPLQMREMRVRLAEQGIDVAAELPAQQRGLTLLRLAPPDPQTRSDLSVLFNRLAFGPIIDQGIRNDPGPIESENGTIRIRLAPPKPVARAREGDVHLRRAADALLEESGLVRFGPFRQTRVYTQAPGRRAVEYVPMYKGVPIYSGYIVLVMGPAGWEEVSIFMPGVVEERGEPKTVLPAPEALLRLAAHLQTATGVQLTDAPALNPRVSIESVDLGYYASVPNRALAWDTVPTWRIAAGSGEIFYVNAFTGDLEPS